jgi:predicted PolB exonuclease-like 3'-5' exonuclease
MATKKIIGIVRARRRWLAFWGYRLSGGMGAAEQAFSGSPTDKIMAFYIGGAVGRRRPVPFQEIAGDASLAFDIRRFRTSRASASSSICRPICGRRSRRVAFRRAASPGRDFLQPHLQRVVVISCVLRDDEGVRVFSVGEPDTGEKETIQRFFEGINKYVPQIVSWNGRGFDLPVLVARGLIHGVTAATFWDTGADNKDFRFSNYISRFHDRHLDLMDVLAMYGFRGSPLDDVAQLSGFPGKIGMDGSEVWPAAQKANYASARLCEADVAAYLPSTCASDDALRTRRSATPRMRAAAHAARSARAHWQKFLSLWKA